MERRAEDGAGEPVRATGPAAGGVAVPDGTDRARTGHGPAASITEAAGVRVGVIPAVVPRLGGGSRHAQAGPAAAGRPAVTGTRGDGRADGHRALRPASSTLSPLPERLEAHGLLRRERRRDDGAEVRAALDSPGMLWRPFQSGTI
ncbi:hypothetical protein GCM10010129_69220 [Streptomyces fumigatiscleroticus]|nr:hypothetical protein GCM10010129_69220 [Streptomyces fumigatiscleroticus]